MIRAYQLCLGPYFYGRCRFFPSCSTYALEAVNQHGGWLGGWMVLKRLGRCHPFAQGGIDPVPQKVK